MRRLFALSLLLATIAWSVPAQEYEVYVGGPDAGLDLVYRDGEFVGGFPGGLLWTLEHIPFEGCGNDIRLIPLPHADTEVLAAAAARLAEFGDIFETMEAMELPAVADPGAVAWVLKAEPETLPTDILRMAQHLRAKAGFIREGWLAFVADRGLALTGWGALFVEIEDGVLTGARYQPYGSSAHDRLQDWGLMGQDEEYSDHPEANGIAEWLTVEGLAPLVGGTFTLGFAVRFE